MTQRLVSLCFVGLVQLLVACNSCPRGQLTCGNACTDTSIDPNNCGACGNVCQGGAVCSQGRCTTTCQSGLLACGNSCINPQTDTTYCGASGDCQGANAGRTCAAGQSCRAGSCTTADTSLTDLRIDPLAVSPSFSTALAAYSAEACVCAQTCFCAGSLSVTPTAADPTATITVNGTTVASGATSAPITLAAGSNTITVQVTKGGASQTYTVTVNTTTPPPPALSLLAGQLGGRGYADGAGATARLDLPSGIAAVGTSDLYIADLGNFAIRRINLGSGQVSTFAGSPDNRFFRDGIGSAAGFIRPASITYDGSGSFFITDSNRIRRIDLSSGSVTTLAGAATTGSTDGTGTAARFNRPEGLVADGAGNLYVTDTNNHTLRRVVIATGEVTTLAGLPRTVGNVDGTGTTARFNFPRGIAFLAPDTLLVADGNNHTLRRVAISTGAVTTLAGAAGVSGSTDGPLANARFNAPRGLTLINASTLIVADSNNHTLRRVDLAGGTVSTLAGAAGSTGSTDGPGASARFDSPRAVTNDGAGNVFVADGFNSTARRVVLGTAQVSTLAGIPGGRGSADGIGSRARFFNASGISYDGGQTLFLTDVNNHTIRALDLSTRAVTTLAGTPGSLGSVDGTRSAARFNGPIAVSYDRSGRLYIADQANHTIRQLVLSSGAVTTLAGSPGFAGSADGVGGEATFNFPDDVVSDQAGSLYVADLSNSTIRRIDVANQAVTTLAGTPGTFSSVDGVGAAASFSSPLNLTYDGAGLLYVSDGTTIRRIDIATRTVTTFAGADGTFGDDDGVGTAARFRSPGPITYDGAGYLYVFDYESRLMRRINTTTAEVRTVFGQSSDKFVVTGPLAQARLNAPGGLTALSAGTLALTDFVENAVLIATLPAPASP